MYVCTHTHIYKKLVLKTILFLESDILHAFSHASWQYNTNAAWPIYSTHAPDLFLLGSLTKTWQSSLTENANCQQKKIKPKPFPLHCGHLEMKIPFRCYLQHGIVASLCTTIKL